MRVCIPTAGIGSRLGSLTKYINKSLVSVANKPVISHLIDQFSNDTEFIIALGYKGDLVRDFLHLAFPDRTFYFEKIEPYEGAGSGLGLSLLKCKKHLQEPFIFLSCDALFRGTLPKLESNWMLYANEFYEDLKQYRTLFLNENEEVLKILEKGAEYTQNHKPYIGIAGILDYEIFWEAMDTGGSRAIEMGEVYGLRRLVNHGIKAFQFKWFDTGNLKAITLTRNAYKESKDPNILEKTNEAIWFVNNQVIKFSDDKAFINNRVKRASEIKEYVPAITGIKPFMYSYNKVKGEVLSNIITSPLFDRFLSHCKSFWKKYSFLNGEEKKFKKSCLTFYKKKTQERVNIFYKNFKIKDSQQSINGVSISTLHDLFEKVDWEWLSNGLAGRFHGDFHFENILWSQEKNSFIFLDWRQDFGGSLSIGDIYYDLAKLLHGLIINHEVIKKNLFSVEWNENSINYDFNRKQSLVECEFKFKSWLIDNKFDFAKVKTLTALIFLNIAALHHYPYSLLLFALGKNLLFKELNLLERKE